MSSVTILGEEEEDNYAPQEKGKETVLESIVSSAQRKKLADISNLQQMKKSEETTTTTMTQQQQNVLFSSTEFVEKLQKENMTLMRALANRNKIIELSSVEFQKLRITLRNLQEKNLQFAQANSQMLAELNTNRDRVKVLQHELSCKDALLNARKMQLEEQTLPVVISEPHDMKHKDTRKKRTSRIAPSGSSNVKPIQVNEKAKNSKRRVSGVVDATGIREETCQTEDDFEEEVICLEENQTVDKVANKKSALDAANPVKDSVPSKRQCARRQSARIHAQETEQPEKLLVTDDAKDTKETARLPLKRRPDRLRPEEAEPCKSVHDREEVREKIKKRRVSARQQSARSEVQEPEVTETLNAADAGCIVIEESVESRSIAVEEPSESRQDTKETNGKRRVSTRRQSAKSKSQTASVTDEAIKEKATDPSLRNDIVQESDPIPSSQDREKKSKKKPKADETEEMTSRTSVGRPSRHAAEKVQSYREISLKVKMRRS